MTRSLHPGTMLGDRYRLDDLLSDFGGARFWRATDTVLARSVAVHAVDSTDPRAQHLLAAARASATLTEPHLLRVLDCDDTETFVWVVNEWGTGASLDVMVAANVLPANRAVWFVTEIADAMVRAHARGLSHGRLSPENVMLTDTGEVKVIGFCVDAALHPVGSAESGNYPGADAIRRDVRDLGGLLFCALVGSWPGASASSVKSTPRDSRGPLRARQIRAGVPRELDSICDRVLSAHRTHDRIDTALELLTALREYAGADTPNAPVLLPPGAVVPAWQLEESTQPIPSLETEPTTSLDVSATEPTTNLDVDPPAPDPLTQDWSLPEIDTAPPAQPPAPILDRPLFAPEGTKRTPKPGAPVDPPAEGSGEAPISAALPEPDQVDTGWPFVETEPQWTEEPARHWLRGPILVGAVVGLLLIGLLTWGLMSRSGPNKATSRPGATTSSQPQSALLKIAGVRDFDPEGDPASENPEQAKFAIDGNPETGWSTLTYRRRPDLGGLKSGVGLLVDLGSIQRVSRVQVNFKGAPTNVTVFAAATDAPQPSNITGLKRLGATTADQDSAEINKVVRTQFLVVWLTSLPKGPGGYRGTITEVRVWS